MSEEERNPEEVVDSTGTDGVRDPGGDGGRPQESSAGARAAEPGTEPLPADDEEAKAGAEGREASVEGDNE